MKVLIDADACPVVDIAVKLCAKEGVPCLLLCDTAHAVYRDGAQTLIFDKGADSVDFALVTLSSLRITAWPPCVWAGRFGSCTRMAGNTRWTISPDLWSSVMPTRSTA